MASRTATAVEVELGWLTRPGSGGEFRRQLLYLPDEPAIVVPHRADGPRWVCDIVGGHPRPRTGWRVTYPAAALARAQTTIVVDPVLLPEEFRLLWQARVAQRWPDGAMATVGRHVAGCCRRDTRWAWRLHLGPTTTAVLVAATQLPPNGLRRALDRLVEARLITALGGAWTQWTLTLPDLCPSPAG